MAVRRSIPLLVFAAMFLCVSAKAADIGEYRYAITKACETWGVPERLVYAIAKQESGHNPWAVNVAGQGFTPKSKEEALKIANRAWTQGRSFDVGLMQINSYWLKKLGFSPEYAIEPRRKTVQGRTVALWPLPRRSRPCRRCYSPGQRSKLNVRFSSKLPYRK